MNIWSYSLPSHVKFVQSIGLGSWIASVSWFVLLLPMQDLEPCFTQTLVRGLTLSYPLPVVPFFLGRWLYALAPSLATVPICPREFSGDFNFKDPLTSSDSRGGTEIFRHLFHWIWATFIKTMRGQLPFILCTLVLVAPLSPPAHLRPPASGSLHIRRLFVFCQMIWAVCFPLLLNCLLGYLKCSQGAVTTF